jgi:hypothetical protein
MFSSRLTLRPPADASRCTLCSGTQARAGLHDHFALEGTPCACNARAMQPLCMSMYTRLEAAVSRTSAVYPHDSVTPENRKQKEIQMHFYWLLSQPRAALHQLLEQAVDLRKQSYPSQALRLFVLTTTEQNTCGQLKKQVFVTRHTERFSPPLAQSRSRQEKMKCSFQI